MPGTLVLDSEGLSKLYRKDRAVITLVQAALEENVRVCTTVMTTLEADCERVHPARIQWALSRIDVHDVTRPLADRAAALLRDHRLRGHEYAIDVVLAALARTVPGPVTVLTSDPEDIGLLCGSAVEVVKV
ncbi:DNA-binding protein [Streptomyces sp. J2-1]|uniref:type II toxin-antitoxin system VapC family toxin n=1 Tax=Streptomyces corallincola TaxID=2851888 RepID=UPI001C387712|nr:DNA-binding protein [Streptomyces corallincola]MBV2357730.1 DNA-binding protein [Streptomyces corallincola]